MTLPQATAFHAAPVPPRINMSQHDEMASRASQDKDKRESVSSSDSDPENVSEVC